MTFALAVMGVLVVLLILSNIFVSWRKQHRALENMRAIENLRKARS